MPLKAQAQEAKDAHVIVATPGRLQDLVDRRLIALDAVEVLVLDEADRMLDMGFKPQVDRLVRKLRDDRQTMFFSATLDGEVGELARSYTHFAARFEGELPADRRTGEIDHRFVPVTPDNKVSTLVELLRREERGLVLVFVRTKAGADRLVEKLRRNDVDAVAIHGDKGQAQREKALEHFDAGKVKTLVATDVAARGLDVDDITHVDQLRPAGGAGRSTRTASAAPAAPARAASAITLVLPEQQADVSRVARLQGHVERFEETGMQVAKPAPRLHVAAQGRPFQVVERRAAHREAGGSAARRARRARRPAPRGRRAGDQEGARVRRPLRELRVPRGEERAGPARGAHPHAALASRRRRDRADAGSDEVGIGSVVEIEGNGRTMTVEVSAVGGDGTVSPTSPLGSALLGRKVGDVVDVEAPKGAWQATIKSIS